MNAVKLTRRYPLSRNIASGHGRAITQESMFVTPIPGRSSWNTKFILGKDEPFCKVATLTPRCGKPEDGVRLFKARTSVLYKSRDTGQGLILAKAMLGRSACRCGTKPRHGPRRLPRAAGSNQFLRSEDLCDLSGEQPVEDLLVLGRVGSLCWLFDRTSDCLRSGISEDLV